VLYVVFMVLYDLVRIVCFVLVWFAGAVCFSLVGLESCVCCMLFGPTIVLGKAPVAVAVSVLIPGFTALTFYAPFTHLHANSRRVQPAPLARRFRTPVLTGGGGGGGGVRRCRSEAVLECEPG
jgi:hypothetical protein